VTIQYHKVTVSIIKDVVGVDYEVEKYLGGKKVEGQKAVVHAVVMVVRR
jgi:hypothetical protein